MLNAASLTGKMNMLPDTVTLTVSAKPASSQADVVVAGCRRRPLNKEEIDYASRIGISVPAVSFMLPAAGLGSYSIKNGDQITETTPAGEVWIVLRTQLEMQKTIFRCLCKQFST